MSGPFDDVLKELDATPDAPPVPADPPPAPPAPNPFDPALKELDATPGPVGTTAVRAAARQAPQVAPDRAATVARLARQTGLPPPAVDENYAQVVAKQQADAANYDAMQANHKALSSWLEDPTHASIAQGDIPQLKALSATAQILTQDEPSEKLPWLTGVIGPAARQTINRLGAQLDAGPAWLQQEARDLTGITSPPNPFTPLGMMYDAWDRDRAEQQAAATYQAPDAMRRLVANVTGMVADPTNVLLPVKGAQLAVRASRVIDEAVLGSQALGRANQALAGVQKTGETLGATQQASQAVTGAALVMGEQSGASALQNASEGQQRALPGQQSSVVTMAANVAVQSAIGFFFGKAGGAIGPLRSLSATPWSSDPIRDWAVDTARFGVIGAQQSIAQGSAQIAITEQRAPTPMEILEQGVTGGVAGLGMGVGGAHEALMEQRHVENLRNAAALQWGTKLGETFQAAQKSASAQRSPEEVGKLLDSIANASGNGAVYLQAEAFQQHVLDQGLDPATEADRAGLGDEYRRAQSLGGDMRLSMRQAIGMGMESKTPDALAGKFRQAPNAPNTHEAVTYYQGAPERDAAADEQAKLLASTAVATSAGAEDMTASQIRKQTEENAIAGGMSPAEAKDLAAFHQRFIVSMADQLNEGRAAADAPPVSPTDLYNQYALRFQSHLPAALDTVVQGGHLDFVLDRLRDQGPQNEHETMAQRSLDELGINLKTQTNEQIKRDLIKRAGALKTASEGEVKTTDSGQRFIIGKSGLGSHYSEVDHAAIIDSRIPEEARQPLVALEHKEAELLREGKPYPEAHTEAVAAQRAESVRLGHDPAHDEGLIDAALKEIEAKPEFSHPVRPEQLEQSGAPANVVEAGKEHVSIGQPIVLHQPRLLNAPRNDSLRTADILRQWTKASGEGEKPSDAEWQKLVEDSMAKDAERLKTFLQEDPKAPRGTFSIGRDLASVITLYRGKNRSTAFHELGHYFLEVMGHIAERPDAPQSLKDNFQKIMEWTGYGSRENMVAMGEQLRDLQNEIGSATPTAEQKAELVRLSKPHETFATTWEDYLAQGKAPSVGLRKAFARLKAWMLEVYKGLRASNIQVSPEIRDTLDRMLASESEIRAAKRRVVDEVAFKDADSAAMTPEQFASYQRLALDVDRVQQEDLERSLLKVEQETRSEVYAEEREKTKAAITDQVAQEKPYQALSALQDGETWDGRKLPDDGTVMKIFKGDIERLLTPEEMMALPGPGKDTNRGKAIFTTGEHGFTADEAASRLGYASGHEMLQDLIHAADRDTRIEALTDDAMKISHPDPMADPKLMEQEADKALHAPDLRGQLFDLERAAIARLNEIKKMTDEADRAEARGAAGDEREMNRRAAAADKVQQAHANAEKVPSAADLAKRVADDQRKAAIARLNDRDERQRMRVAAEAEINATKISATDPSRFMAAERKSALNVREALAKKDYEGALQWKRRQMMNAELARASQNAHDQADKDQARLKKAATDNKWRQQIAKAGGWEWTVQHPDGRQTVFDKPDAKGVSAQEQARTEAMGNPGATYDRTSGYLDQIDQLLERMDLRRRAPGDRRARNSLRDFLRKEGIIAPDGTRLAGPSAHIPDHIIDDVMNVNWSNMTPGDLHDLRSSVEALAAMARLKNELIMSTGRQDVQEAVNEIITGIRDPVKAAEAMDHHARTGTLHPDESGIRFHAFRNPKRIDGTTGLTVGTRQLAGTLHDLLIQIPAVAFEMDGFKNSGPMQRLYLHPMADAADAKLMMMHELNEKVKEAHDRYGKIHRIGTYVRKQIPGTDRPMTLLNRIVILMHYGNPEGRQRLLDLNHWDDAAVHRIIDGLDDKDIRFANDMVDIMESHWSDIKAQEEKYQGIAPPKVEPIPVDMPAGRYKGGYQHIYYVGESATSLEHIADAMLNGKSIERPGLRSPGYTKARAKGVKDQIISLDPANWERHINEMAHDLTHRDLVVNSLKMLANKDFRDAIITTQGAGIYQQFKNQIRGIAASDKPAITAYERVMENMRISVNYAHRAFNPIFALAHFSGFVNGLSRVEPLRLGSAMMQMHVMGPWSTTAQWIKDQSTTMRFRNETRNNFTGNSPWASNVRRMMDLGMAPVVKIWEHLDNVLWKGAYDAHMQESGNNHDEAVRVADQIVESTFGSDKQKDKAELMRAGGPLMKMFTSSMQYDSALLNGILTSINRTRHGAATNDVGQIAKGVGGAFVLAAVSGLLWDFMSDQLEGKGVDKWEGQSLAKRVALSGPASMLRAIPVLREIEPNLIEGQRHEGVIGLSWLTNLQDAATQLHSPHPKMESTVKAITKALSDVLPIPATQIFRSYEGLQYSQQHRANLTHQIWQTLVGPPQKNK